MIKYSEIFYSMQGEGKWTGSPTIWLRLFSCNLQCNGFGQKDPTAPGTYELPYKEIEGAVKGGKYKTMKDLPVFEKGCDSSYSWSKIFKDMQHTKTPCSIVDEFQSLLKSKWNPEGLFEANHGAHLCFTGGEPLMPANQLAILRVLKELEARGDLPMNITFETNGTQLLSDALLEYINKVGFDEVTFSVSPKLFSVSGERGEKAIKPQVVESYSRVTGSHTYLKFVVGDSDEQWQELEMVKDRFDQELPVWIMPTGGTQEAQENVAANVADEALRRGYNVSARVHNYIWGNAIGK